MSRNGSWISFKKSSQMHIPPSKPSRRPLNRCHPRNRIYVEVDVTHKTDGTARPRKIKFEDGEVYEIDRVRHCCRAASTKVGGTGLRYTVMICGTETFLFDEENGKWFVEGKKRAVL